MAARNYLGATIVDGATLLASVATIAVVGIAICGFGAPVWNRFDEFIEIRALDLPERDYIYIVVTTGIAYRAFALGLTALMIGAATKAGRNRITVTRIMTATCLGGILLFVVPYAVYTTHSMERRMQAVSSWLTNALGSDRVSMHTIVVNSLLTWTVCCPMGLLFVRRRHRCRVGHCVKCGYNLTGNISGVCPECGTEIPGTVLFESGDGPPQG